MRRAFGVFAEVGERAIVSPSTSRPMLVEADCSTDDQRPSYLESAIHSK